jgi:hypothetical protein
MARSIPRGMGSVGKGKNKNAIKLFTYKKWRDLKKEGILKLSRKSRYSAPINFKNIIY